MEAFGDVVRHALEIASGNNLAEVELRQGELEFRAKLTPRKKAKPTVNPLTTTTTGEDQTDHVEIKASAVGYYRAPKKPIAHGDAIEVGTSLGSLVALNIPSDIESEHAGSILESLVKDGDAVMYGQPLFKVKV